MRYRIAIGVINDTGWCFDHYATKDEMSKLRVDATGKVEMILVGCVGEGSSWRAVVKWIDVSETHVVENGYFCNVYAGDILAYNGGTATVICDDGMLWVEDSEKPEGPHPIQYIEEDFPEFRVIGNIHERDKR